MRSNNILKVDINVDKRFRQTVAENEKQVAFEIAEGIARLRTIT
jgi:hypothetical protein